MDGESGELEEEQVLMVVSLNEFMDIVLSVKQVIYVFTHFTQIAPTHLVTFTLPHATSHMDHSSQLGEKLEAHTSQSALARYT